MVLKPQQAKVSRKAKMSAKTSGSRRENLRIVQIKPQPADMNYLKNHLGNHTGAASPPPPVRVDIPVPDNERERAYGALWQVYPYHPNPADRESEPDARQVFNQLLDDGVDPEEITTAAAAYAERCIGLKKSSIDFMVYWLRHKDWGVNFDKPAAMKQM
jgi:hypothetical protein